VVLFALQDSMSCCTCMDTAELYLAENRQWHCLPCKMWTSLQCVQHGSPLL
jgi:hypothetical protein